MVYRSFRKFLLQILMRNFLKSANTANNSIKISNQPHLTVPFTTLFLRNKTTHHQSVTPLQVRTQGSLFLTRTPSSHHLGCCVVCVCGWGWIIFAHSYWHTNERRKKKECVWKTQRGQEIGRPVAPICRFGELLSLSCFFIFWYWYFSEWRWLVVNLSVLNWWVSCYFCIIEQ